ncbi:hypothetical protein NQ317_009694 [Molorchus minor]|uniref:Tyr recombinase domain-containing protein n=1 Tax=Molorchus minor TaxID=1323400 RepID=A0ABQ9JGV4_9CUCU|nr:hypothetical protein NQ317_009694 [Molorchus minor]
MNWTFEYLDCKQQDLRDTRQLAKLAARISPLVSKIEESYRGRYFISAKNNSTLYCKGEKCVILAEVQFEARGLQCAEDKIASLPNVSSTRIICTMNNCESEEIVEAANIAISNLLPTKSRSLYDIAYNRENAKNYKSSTLWAQYSMVKSCLIIYDNIDISKFPKLIAFLKRTGDGYQAKKSKILTKTEIDRFLLSADDKEFLMIKVGLILRIAGACRTDELVNLTVDDIKDVGSSLIVKIPNTKTKIPRIFVVTDVGNILKLFRKYLSLRPPHVKHKRLFCTTNSQPVGKNTMGKIPSVVASYLKLPDVACYTGHCLRRSSAILLADAGVDITTIKRHAGWKSTTVAEGYVENSIENKTKIANQVLVGTTTSAIFLLILILKIVQMRPFGRKIVDSLLRTVFNFQALRSDVAVSPPFLGAIDDK